MDVESLLDVVEYTLAEVLAAAVGLIAGAFTGLLFRVLFVSLEQALASFTVAVPALHQNAQPTALRHRHHLRDRKSCY